MLNNTAKAVPSALPKHLAEMVHITNKGPMDLACVNFLSIEPDQSNTTDLLVITDHFTQYAQAFLTKDQHASTVIKVLRKQYSHHYSLPARAETSIIF